MHQTIKPCRDPSAFFSEWRWENFEPEDFRCKHTGLYLIYPSFLDRLQALRTECDFPFIITSGYRDPAHPIERRKPKPGSHATGRAVDIAVVGERARQVILRHDAFGFTGLGVNQSGSSRFIHLDDLGADEFHASRPNVWSY